MRKRTPLETRRRTEIRSIIEVTSIESPPRCPALWAPRFRMWSRCAFKSDLPFTLDGYEKFLCWYTSTFDSSVGRAVDCRWYRAVIHRSLVQIRLEGYIFLIFKKFTHSTSINHFLNAFLVASVIWKNEKARFVVSDCSREIFLQSHRDLEKQNAEPCVSYIFHWKATYDIFGQLKCIQMELMYEVYNTSADCEKDTGKREAQDWERYWTLLTWDSKPNRAKLNTQSKKPFPSDRPGILEVCRSFSLER